MKKRWSVGMSRQVKRAVLGMRQVFLAQETASERLRRLGGRERKLLRRVTMPL